MGAPTFATEPLAPITAPAEPLMDWEYELLAGTDDAEGWRAWNAGNYARAVRMWLSAARWEQYARAARGSV